MAVDLSALRLKMEVNSKVTWMLERVNYVRHFLKFSLFAAVLSEESENDRAVCIELLDEIVKSLTEDDKSSEDRIYVDMNCGTSATVSLAGVDLTERDQYANVPFGQHNPVENTISSYCTRERNTGTENIYAMSDRNNAQLNGIDNGHRGDEQEERAKTSEEKYINISMLNEARSGSTIENGPRKIDQNLQEDVKLFPSALDIEDKWRRITADNMEYTGLKFQQEAISALNTMKKQSSVYIKKSCFCFGYLYQRKRRFFGHVWNKIYAVVKKNVMLLYKSEFEEKALEVIILSGYNVLEVEEKNGKAGFQLLPVTVLDPECDKPRPSHRFRCDSAEFEVWQKAFSFPVWQAKKDNKREMDWLKVAKSFDYSTSDESLHANKGSTFPYEANKERRKSAPPPDTPAAVTNRERSSTEYSPNSSSAKISEYDLMERYRSPCPLPTTNSTIANRLQLPQPM